MLLTGSLQFSCFYFIGLFSKHFNTSSKLTRSEQFGDHSYSYGSYSGFEIILKLDHN